MSKVGTDTDGTKWMTVRYTVDVTVMAENDDEALLHAGQALADYYIELEDSGEVVEQ